MKDSLIYLVRDAHTFWLSRTVPIDPRQPATGAEAGIMAECAATRGNGPIDVWTGESGIYTYFLHAAAKPLF